VTYECKSYIIAPFIAIGGTVIGILGSILRELFHYSYILVFIAAPIIEEALKPTGLYLMLVLWPKMLKGRIYTALLSALAGLTFAIIENILYLKVYFPHHSLDIVLFRYTAGIGIHVICSFILGFGINQKLLASIRGEIPFLQDNKKFFFIPMILHSLYNVVVVVFSKRMGLQ
jgi:RsiW-degrading membrane proteinase PrsW (M82 family)